MCLGWARPRFQAKKSICCGTSIEIHYAKIALQFLQPLMGFYGLRDFCISPRNPSRKIKRAFPLDLFPDQDLFSHCPLSHLWVLSIDDCKVRDNKLCHCPLLVFTNKLIFQKLDHKFD